MNLVLCFRRDQFMEELENEELNRELCALAVDDMLSHGRQRFKNKFLLSGTTGKMNLRSPVTCVISAVKSLRVRMI